MGETMAFETVFKTAGAFAQEEAKRLGKYAEGVIVGVR
jgi:hypothetical protein